MTEPLSTQHAAKLLYSVMLVSAAQQSESADFFVCILSLLV